MAKKPKYTVLPNGTHEAIRMVNGKRVAFRGKTDKEVERKMMAYKERAALGRTFKEVAGEWEDIHFPTLAHNSLNSYRPALRRAVEEFGEEYINTIKAPAIKKFIAAFSRGGMGQKAVSNQLLVTRLIFTHAVVEGDIEYNPCTSVTTPKSLPKGHREAASKEDEARVKQNPTPWLLPYLILYTGLRKGEALALTYGDIDMDAKVIHVTKSVYYENAKPKIKTPKTESGMRTVPIFDPLATVLPKGKPNHYLFSTDGGITPMKDKDYYHHYEAYKMLTGITCTAHQLRHSFATILFELDVDAKIAQNLLGHSTEAMTREIYTHLRTDKLAQATKDINARLTANDTQNPPTTHNLHRATVLS